MGRLSSVRKRLENGNCIALAVSSQVVEVVGACYYLMAARNDSECSVMGAEFGIDGSSESIDAGSVISRNSGMLRGSKHFQKILYSHSYLHRFN